MIDKSIRFANFAIDLLAYMFILAAIFLSSYIIYPEKTDEVNQAADIISYSVYFLYYFVFELIAGRTIGKILTKTIVVDLHGNKPGFVKILGRTLLRFVPFDALSFVFSFRGMHDVWTKTKLTSTRREIPFTDSPNYHLN